MTPSGDLFGRWTCSLSLSLYYWSASFCGGGDQKNRENEIRVVNINFLRLIGRAVGWTQRTDGKIEMGNTRGLPTSRDSVLGWWGTGQHLARDWLPHWPYYSILFLSLFSLRSTNHTSWRLFCPLSGCHDSPSTLNLTADWIRITNSLTTFLLSESLFICSSHNSAAGHARQRWWTTSGVSFHRIGNGRDSLLSVDSINFPLLVDERDCVCTIRLWLSARVSSFNHLVLDKSCVCRPRSRILHSFPLSRMNNSVSFSYTQSRLVSIDFSFNTLLHGFPFGKKK